MIQRRVIVFFIFLIAASALAQTDTSYFKDWPADSILAKNGFPTRGDILRNMHVSDSINAQDFPKKFQHAWDSSAQDVPPTGIHPEDDDHTMTLEELIENHSQVEVLVIDLKAHPMARLPEHFSTLGDLKFLVIANEPAESSFDFAGAIKECGC